MDDLFVVLNDIKDILLNTINFQFIIKIILIILNCCLGLYVTWFGIKKLIGVIQGALIGKLEVGSFAHRNYHKNVLGWDDEDYNDRYNQW